MSAPAAVGAARPYLSDRHLTVVPDLPALAPCSAPTSRPARGLPPDLMWLAIVGPAGALGAFALVSAWLVARLGTGWTIGLYGVVVGVLVVTGTRWAR